MQARPTDNLIFAKLSENANALHWKSLLKLKKLKFIGKCKRAPPIIQFPKFFKNAIALNWKLLKNWKISRLHKNASALYR